MSDPRHFRTDNRRRHDGVDTDPAHQPGPVKHLVAGGQRINVTAAAAAAALEKAGSLTWEQMVDESRRLASVILSRVASSIDAGAIDAETVNTLQKVFGMAKASITSIQPTDPSALSLDELKKAAK